MSRGALGLIGGLTVLAVVLATTDGSDRGAGLFVGRLHPVLVHLPIGILVLAAGLELARRFPRLGNLPATPRYLFLAGAWSAILAATTGRLLIAGGRGYDAATLLWHQRIGVTVALLASGLYFLSTRRSPNGDRGRWYRGGLAVLLMGLVVGGHLGGTLTHGEGFLTSHLPDPIRAGLGLPRRAEAALIRVTGADTATVYGALIQPILSRRCGACHDTEHRRGGLALTTWDGLRAGGKDGQVLVPGRADESEMIRRLWLPPGDPEAMPPNDRIPVAEAELLRWWIGQGAKADGRLAEADPPPVIRRIFDAYGLSDLPTGIFALKVAPADSEAIEAIERTGLAVEPLAGRGGYLRVHATNARRTFEPQALVALRPAGAQLAWLDLGGTAVGDSGLALLSDLPHLTRLHLENTRVTDQGLPHLARLRYLEYLNLYNTQVTDAGLSALDSLGRLKVLYLWGTRVTPAGVASLRRSLPRLTINFGDPAVRVAGPAPPTAEPKAKT